MVVRRRSRFLFLPRHNRVSQGRRMVYDHLMLPIRKISRFRHGAEVALSAAANRDATARALNEISAYSCMATSAIMLAAATFIGYANAGRLEMDLGLLAGAAPLGLGVLIALGGILVMMSYLSE